MTEKELDKILADIKEFITKYPTENNLVYLEGAKHAISAIKISTLSESPKKSKKGRIPLEVGDTVLIVGPRTSGECLPYPLLPGGRVSWVRSMDPFKGKELTISRIYETGILEMSGEIWSFHPNWVQKVESTAIKIGDKVRVTKPKDTTEGPRWVDAMDRFHRQVLTVKELYSAESIQVKETTWNFSPKWLTKIPNFKEGDKVVIQKPKNKVRKLSPVGWVDSMDKFDGAIVILPKISEGGTFFYNGWFFDLLWCKK